jgi:hypothetical protein
MYKQKKTIEDGCLLGCCAVQSGRSFRGACCLHHQGDAHHDVVYQPTRRNNPEDSHLHTRRENMKSQNKTIVSQIKLSSKEL